MEYKLYKGYILGPGYQNPAYDVYEVDIFRCRDDAISGNTFHTSESEWEAQQWIDREQEQEYGSAHQWEVDELNKATVIEPKYPDHIMDKVRQSLGLEPGDTSKDAEINAMSRDAVFDHCLNWEGLINYGNQMRDWIQDIYGVNVSTFGV